jgi:hypothetical protein
MKNYILALLLPCLMFATSSSEAVERDSTQSTTRSHTGDMQSFASATRDESDHASTASSYKSPRRRVLNKRSHLCSHNWHYCHHD